jgi:hypothetical protein
VGQSSEHLGRIVCLTWAFDLFPEQFGDPVEEAVLSLGMVVDGHRVDVEFFGEASHGESVEALLVDHSEGGLQDSAPVESFTCGDFGGHAVAPS